MVVEDLAVSQEVEQRQHRQEPVEHSIWLLEGVGRKDGEEIVSIERVEHMESLAIVPAIAVEIGLYIGGSESEHLGCLAAPPPAGIEKGPSVMSVWCETDDQRYPELGVG